MRVGTRRVAGPAGPTRRVASQPQAALVLHPAVREVATVVDEVAVDVQQRPHVRELVQAPDELFPVLRGKARILEVKNWYSVREVVPRIGVEELGFSHAAVVAHEVVESPWLSVGNAPLNPLVAGLVYERGALRGLHDEEAGVVR